MDDLIERLRRWSTFGYGHEASLTMTEAADRITSLQQENERLREALYLFREFTLRNATQWQTGANHHHPIYPMIAELLQGMHGIVPPEWSRFVNAENRAALRGEG